jgi:hypothetical protein
MTAIIFAEAEDELPQRKMIENYERATVNELAFTCFSA